MDGNHGVHCVQQSHEGSVNLTDTMPQFKLSGNLGLREAAWRGWIILDHFSRGGEKQSYRSLYQVKERESDA